MRNYDLYGAKNIDLAVARTSVETGLHVTLLEHESDYHGGVYYRIVQSGEEELILKMNRDIIEEEWAEPTFNEYSVLLYVNHSSRPRFIQAQLKKVGGFDLLRSEEFPD